MKAKHQAKLVISPQQNQIYFEVSLFLVKNLVVYKSSLMS